MAKTIQVKIDPKSLESLKKVSNELYKDVNDEMQKSVDKVMTEVFNESQELVPVATGALRESGRLVKTPSVGNLQSETYISYGDGLVDYAIYVHENLQDIHESPTQAKYLETPMAQAEPTFKKEIQNGIRIALSRFGFKTSGGMSGDLSAFGSDSTTLGMGE